MKGDFTRFTFDPGKHYDSVLMQQGRVQTDADWNEQVQIAAHRTRMMLFDIFGPTGTPQDFKANDLGSFVVHYSLDATSQQRRLFINQGHYFVHGLLVESEAPVLFESQPGATLTPTGGAGTYLVYLDVWRRHITALEDPDIREVALEGADSGTRSKVVWQVRLQREGDLGVVLAEVDIRKYGTQWRPTGLESSGAMDVRVEAGSLPPENQLYRVEIHRGGGSGAASFKWSRDNGTVVAAVLNQSTLTERTVVRGGVEVSVWQFSIEIDPPGRDSFGSFLPGHMVELSSDELILQRKPGIFATVTRVVGATLYLEVPKNAVSAPLSSTDGNLNPLAGTTRTVRRWDNTWNPDTPGLTLPDGGRFALEHGITVKFAEGGLYQPGDYWLIPARKVSGLEGWVTDQQRPPAGEQHYHAPLALVKLQADGTVSDLRDIRDVFPTLRSVVPGKGGFVQGTATGKNRVPRWQDSGSFMLVDSGITDNGSSVTVDSSLKVGSATTSVIIKRFTSASIPLESEPDAVVPTTVAVKNYVEGVVSGTSGKLGKFTGSNKLGDSLISESGTTVTVGGSLQVGSGTDTITKFSNGALSPTGSQEVPTSQAVASYVKARGFGSGTANKLVKWSGTDTTGTSRLSDDGSLVKVESNTEVTGTLKVGGDTSAVTISRFTSSAIKSMAAAELGSTVPTSQAVKDFAMDFVNVTVPAGTVVAYAGETAPAGWLECDGSSLDGGTGAGSYPNLFKAIGKFFGSGSGSTTGFNLPDLRGRFIRGWNHRGGKGGPDVDAGQRVASASGGNVGDRVGSYQDDQYKTHSHGVSLAGKAEDYGFNHDHPHAVLSNFSFWDTESDDGAWGVHNHNVVAAHRRRLGFYRSENTDSVYISHGHSLSLSATVAEAGGSESRPKNVYLMFIIKY